MEKFIKTSTVQYIYLTNYGKYIEVTPASLVRVAEHQESHLMTISDPDPLLCILN